MLVLFYPHLINKGHSKVKQLVFCEYLGLKITTNPKDNWSVCCYMDFRDVNKPPKWLKFVKTVTKITLGESASNAITSGVGELVNWINLKVAKKKMKI